MFDLANEKVKTIKIDNEEFKITAIFMKERREIAVKRAYLQNNLSVDAFTMTDIQSFEKTATVDVCVLDKPERFDKHDRCEEWGDDLLVDDLFEKITKLTKRIESKLKKK